MSERIARKRSYVLALAKRNQKVAALVFFALVVDVVAPVVGVEPEILLVE